MGFRISWLAVHGMTREAMLDALNLADTGEVDEANEASFSIAQLPGGWTVLWAADEFYADENRAAHLSRSGATVVAVRVNETCMHSTASLFDAGRRALFVHHEGDERIDHLVTDGTLPPAADAIVADARARQAAEDADRPEVDWFFEIPPEIARAVCGYKHDLWQFEWGEPAFTVVVPRRDATESRSQGRGFPGQLFSGS